MALRSNPEEAHISPEYHTPNVLVSRQAMLCGSPSCSAQAAQGVWDPPRDPSGDNASPARPEGILPGSFAGQTEDRVPMGRDGAYKEDLAKGVSSWFWERF